jgi:uncharacterized protein (DUF58 family)
MTESTRRLFDPDFLKRLDELSIVSRRVSTGQAKGERRTNRKGSGVEFVDYRPYTVGDDLRYVDWNIYSRLDKLLLKLYVEEEDMCLHLLVDGSGSMGFGNPPKLDYAIRVAAALGYIGLTNLERVALGLLTNDVTRMLRPLRGRGQILPIMDFLAGVEAGGPTALNHSLARYALRSRMPGVAVVLTDLLDAGGYVDGLKALLQRRFDVVLLHVVSEDELEPELQGDLTLVDAEGGTAREVSVDRWALERYQERLAQHFEAAERFCTRHGIDYLRTSTAMPFQELILHHLRRGGFLR